MGESWDVAVIGGGAAGLMAAVSAGRSGAHPRVIVVDGAKHLGAKILVAGGGRCNVTHETVDEADFCGSSPKAIAKVLRRFSVADTVSFFADLGVELKREETGKLFPVTDRARSVLDALLAAARGAGVTLRHPWRTASVKRNAEGFVLREAAGAPPISARCVVLATGGKSLPKSGSDGQGYSMARALGHTLTPRILPALVPLCLPGDHPFTGLSGISFPARLEVQNARGKRLAAVTGPVLCTHFGISGPAVLDVSRHFLSARAEDPGARIVLDALPDLAADALDAELRALGSRTTARFLWGRHPERLARVLLQLAEVPGDRAGATLSRSERRRLVTALKELDLPITGDRGFRQAEVTAGGVPLSELRLETMESRACPGLYLCGEICDVDGRIGGFNFQWAWASGWVAGTAAGAAQDPRG